MKTLRTFLVSFSALFLAQSASATLPVTFPVLEQFRIPPYPYLARLAAMEGTVEADIGIDKQCGVTGIKIGKADSRLVEAVKRSLYGDTVPLRFSPCAISRPMIVRILYVFSLKGQPTNRWSQTNVDVSTDGGRSFYVNITTTPPDLATLGLKKIGRRTKDVTDRKTGRYDQSSGRKLQTIFTSPNYGVRNVGLQGDVRVEVDLNSNCSVSSATTQSNRILAEGVVQAVHGWEFPGCSSNENSLELVFHFLLTEPDSPSPHGNWAPTHFEMISSHEFQVRTVGPDPIIDDEFKIK